MAITYGGNDDTKYRGTFDLSSGTLVLKDGQLDRSWQQETVEAQLGIPLESLLTWDDLSARLPGTAASDDLGIIEGTWGTDAPTIQTSDAKATSVTQRARFRIPIGNDYNEGESLKIRVRGGMITTVSDGTATVDLEVYSIDKDGSVGTDLCATAATTINSLSKADVDFTITNSGLSHGDILDCRVTVAITDTATGTAVIGELSAITLMRNILG